MCCIYDWLSSCVISSIYVVCYICYIVSRYLSIACACFFFFFCCLFFFLCFCFFFQAEDGIRDLVRSRGLGDVYKRQAFTSMDGLPSLSFIGGALHLEWSDLVTLGSLPSLDTICLLYTSDAADERSSVDLGGRRIIKKKTIANIRCIIV